MADWDVHKVAFLPNIVIHLLLADALKLASFLVLAAVKHIYFPGILSDSIAQCVVRW